jgi:hypothetical protein
MSIIDVHSHFWQFPEHFNDDFRTQIQQHPLPQRL